MFSITYEMEFSAAHFLPGHPKCGKTHGHNFQVLVTLESEQLNENGMVMDFAELKSFLEPNLPDHKLLNDVMDLIPTSENLAWLFYQCLKLSLPNPSMLVEVTVFETDKASATYWED